MLHGPLPARAASLLALAAADPALDSPPHLHLSFSALVASVKLMITCYHYPHKASQGYYTDLRLSSTARAASRLALAAAVAALVAAAWSLRSCSACAFLSASAWRWRSAASRLCRCLSLQADVAFGTGRHAAGH